MLRGLRTGEDGESLSLRRTGVRVWLSRTSEILRSLVSKYADLRGFDEDIGHWELDEWTSIQVRLLVGGS